MYHMTIRLRSGEVTNAYGLCLELLIRLVEAIHGDDIAGWTVKRV
jgi:hypothetical protein